MRPAGSSRSADSVRPFGRPGSSSEASRSGPALPVDGRPEQGMEGHRGGSCYFCRRPEATGEPSALTLYADDLVCARHLLNDHGPTYLGVVLVQSRRHTEEGLAGLTDDEGARIGWVVARVSRALRERSGAAWTYTFCFTEGYRHVHQYIVARYAGMPPRFARLAFENWAAAPRGGPEALHALCARLRDAIGTDPRRP